MKGIDNVISSLNLPEELKQQIAEAWESAVQENKEDAVRELREEYEQRYKQDLETMVSAADTLISESLDKELTEFNEDRKKLHEGKKALVKQLRRAKALKESYDQKFEDRVKVFETFVLDTLKEELTEFNQDKQKLEESINDERIKLVKEQMRTRKLAESKEKALNDLITNALREEVEEFVGDRKKFMESMNKLEGLVVGQLTEELSEFQEDRKQLQEKRVELEKEYTKKLDEAKKVFVQRASKSADAVVNETLKEELSSLKEDIRLAKENTFGRKLFEAFASEFYYSHLAENTEVAKVSKQLSKTQENLEKMQKIVQEQRETINNNKRQLKEAKETSKRDKVVSDLVRPLSGVQRKIMCSLLEGVETKDLEKSFERYLPSVLERSTSKKKGERKVVTENDSSKKTQKKFTEVTGERKNGNQNQTQTLEEDVSEEELKQMLLNAGIKR